MANILLPAGPALADTLHMDYTIITNMCECYNFDVGGPEKPQIYFVWPKVYVNITHACTQRLLCYRTSSFSGLGWAYIWATTGELQSRNGLPVHKILVLQILWPLFMYSGCGVYKQATPRLLNACVADCDKFARNQMSVSRNLTVVSDHSLGLED